MPLFWFEKYTFLALIHHSQNMKTNFVVVFEMLAQQTSTQSKGLGLSTKCNV